VKIETGLAPVRLGLRKPHLAKRGSYWYCGQLGQRYVRAANPVAAYAGFARHYRSPYNIRRSLNA
jgi:hypothetical protein